MRVLTFTSLYPNNVWPNHGVFIKERMTHFAALEGCEVKVVAPVPYFPPLQLGHRFLFSQVLRREVIAGLDVYHPRYFMVPKVGMALYGILMFLSVLPVVKRIQQDFNFDIIDAHYIYPDGFAAVLLGHLFRKPVIISARGSDINLFVEFPLIRWLLQYTLHKANKVIAVCQALKDAMVQLEIPQEKIWVIPNGVDMGKFHPFPKGDARKKLALPMDKRVILSVGGLIPRKGFDLLIKALKILFEELHQKNLYLVIVGEGKARKELEQLITSLHLSEYVRLVGDIPHQQLYLWYSAADLFCLASSREGWPNVLLESLACGTPVVAASVWGIPEVIRSEEVGLLTQRNERQLAEKLFLALNKTWRPEAIVRFAREQTWDRVAYTVFQAFTSALNDQECLLKKHSRTVSLGKFKGRYDKN
jgi:glycosyltransferase involved in cell wall biosynthesis